MSGLLEAVSFREFWSDDRIRNLVADSVDRTASALYPRSTLPGDSGNLRATRSLLIFSTSKQQTWLVADRHSLRCVLDDRRKEEPRIQWSIGKDEAEPLVADYDYSAKSGILHVGTRRKGWLFSKHLFQIVDVASSIRRLLAESS